MPNKKKKKEGSSVGASKRKVLSGVKKAGQSKHKRAGLVFPVSRVYRQYKKGNFAPRVGLGARFVL
jgi:hypothetical protein